MLPSTASVEKSTADPASNPGSWLTQPARLGALICLAVFLLTMALVQSRALAPVDFAIATSLITIDNSPLDALSAWAATLLAFEACMVYAVILSFILLRRGAGLWSLAPYAFVVLTCVELVMKLTFYQPGVPA